MSTSTQTTYSFENFYNIYDKVVDFEMWFLKEGVEIRNKAEELNAKTGRRVLDKRTRGYKYLIKERARMREDFTR